MNEIESFWNWSGHYVGYRLTDCLFSQNGQQLGYFAEGDEVYGCTGEYLGEIRTRGRLITNLRKKAWTRRTVVPGVQRSSPGHANVSAKDMLAEFEDFPAPLSKFA